MWDVFLFKMRIAALLRLLVATAQPCTDINAFKLAPLLLWCAASSSSS
jgi:hypothetical protein